MKAMERNTALLVGALVFAACGGAGTDSSGLDLSGGVLVFSGGTERPRWPRLGLLADSVNHAIARQCAMGAGVGELQSAGVADLEERLRVLVEGNVVLLDERQRCVVAFPVLTGDRRQSLGRVASDAAARLVPLADSMIDVLRPAAGDRAEMLFHLLWSRVIDEVWYAAWRRVGAGEEGPTDVAWVLDPAHPYMVGTNYAQMPGGGSLAMTWSRRFDGHLAQMSALGFAMYQAAWQRPVTDSADVQRLREHGFVHDGSFDGYVYHAGDTLDVVLDSLRERYAAAVARVVDWTAPPPFDLTRSDYFVILLHETAYALFELLDRSGSLTVPTALREGGSPRSAVDLTSLVLREETSPEDDAMALYMADGWHGSARVIAMFERVLGEAPENTNVLLYLGMSLYDVGEYRRAVEVFERLRTLTRDNARLARQHDWSLVWIGHCHDAMGDRDGAIDAFRTVALTADSTLSMQFGQYGIGPVNAVEWARERLSTPWRWQGADRSRQPPG